MRSAGQPEVLAAVGNPLVARRVERRFPEEISMSQHSAHPQPPQPQQKQSPPGYTQEMIPKPDHGEQSYRGSGRLAGKTAIITGAELRHWSRCRDRFRA